MPIYGQGNSQGGRRDNEHGIFWESFAEDIGVRQASSEALSKMLLGMVRGSGIAGKLTPDVAGGRGNLEVYAGNGNSINVYEGAAFVGQVPESMFVFANESATNIPITLAPSGTTRRDLVGVGIKSGTVDDPLRWCSIDIIEGLQSTTQANTYIEWYDQGKSVYADASGTQFHQVAAADQISSTYDLGDTHLRIAQADALPSPTSVGTWAALDWSRQIVYDNSKPLLIRFLTGNLDGGKVRIIARTRGTDEFMSSHVLTGSNSYDTLLSDSTYSYAYIQPSYYTPNDTNVLTAQFKLEASYDPGTSIEPSAFQKYTQTAYDKFIPLAELTVTDSNITIEDQRYVAPGTSGSGGGDGGGLTHQEVLSLISGAGHALASHNHNYAATNHGHSEISHRHEIEFLHDDHWISENGGSIQFDEGFAFWSSNAIFTTNVDEALRYAQIGPDTTGFTTVRAGASIYLAFSHDYEFPFSKLQNVSFNIASDIANFGQFDSDSGRYNADGSIFEYLGSSAEGFDVYGTSPLSRASVCQLLITAPAFFGLVSEDSHEHPDQEQEHEHEIGKLIDNRWIKFDSEHEDEDNIISVVSSSPIDPTTLPSMGARNAIGYLINTSVTQASANLGIWIPRDLSSGSINTNPVPEVNINAYLGGNLQDDITLNLGENHSSFGAFSLQVIDDVDYAYYEYPLITGSWDIAISLLEPIYKGAVERAGDGPGTHNHDSDYSATGHTHAAHNHDSTYAPIHSHPYAGTSHTHDTSHNHDSSYSATGHSHVGSDDHTHSSYSATGHSHVGSDDHTHSAYSGSGHTHSAYSATDHTHAASAPADHNHDIGRWGSQYKDIIGDDKDEAFFILHGSVWTDPATVVAYKGQSWAYAGNYQLFSTSLNLYLVIKVDGYADGSTEHEQDWKITTIDGTGVEFPSPSSFDASVAAPTGWTYLGKSSGSAAWHKDARETFPAGGATVTLEKRRPIWVGEYDHTHNAADHTHEEAAHNHDSSYSATGHAHVGSDDHTHSAYAPTHSHPYAATSHNHDTAYAATTHGTHVPAGGTAGTYLEGDGSWSTPAGAGGGDTTQVTFAIDHVDDVTLHSSAFRVGPELSTLNDMLWFQLVYRRGSATDDIYFNTLIQKSDIGATQATAFKLQLQGASGSYLEVYTVNNNQGNDAIAFGSLDSTFGSGTVKIYNVIEGAAAGTHNHDSAYAPTHDHPYSGTSHTHDYSSSFSAVGHNHDSSYSATSHTHVGSDDHTHSAYSGTGHTHDTSHNHDTAYSASGHAHVGSDDHTHSAYSGTGHTHPTHAHPYAATTHGTHVPAGGTAGTYLEGDGSWSTPAGTGGGSDTVAMGLSEVESLTLSSTTDVSSTEAIGDLTDVFWLTFHYDRSTSGQNIHFNTMMLKDDIGTPTTPFRLQLQGSGGDYIDIYESLTGFLTFGSLDSSYLNGEVTIYNVTEGAAEDHNHDSDYSGTSHTHPAHDHDASYAPTHAHPYAATTHGEHVPSGGTAGTYLEGDGSWSTPDAGSGDELPEGLLFKESVVEYGWDAGIDFPSGETFLDEPILRPNGDIVYLGSVTDKVYTLSNGAFDSGIDFPSGEVALDEPALRPNGDIVYTGSVADKVYTLSNGAFDSGIDSPSGEIFPSEPILRPNGDIVYVGPATGKVYTLSNGAFDSGIDFPSGEAFTNNPILRPNGDIVYTGSVADKVYTLSNGAFDSGINFPSGEDSLDDPVLRPNGDIVYNGSRAGKVYTLTGGAFSSTTIDFPDSETELDDPVLRPNGDIVYIGNATDKIYTLSNGEFDSGIDFPPGETNHGNNVVRPNGDIVYIGNATSKIYTLSIRYPNNFTWVRPGDGDDYTGMNVPRNEVWLSGSIQQMNAAVGALPSPNAGDTAITYRIVSNTIRPLVYKYDGEAWFITVGNPLSIANYIAKTNGVRSASLTEEEQSQVATFHAEPSTSLVIPARTSDDAIPDGSSSSAERVQYPTAVSDDDLNDIVTAWDSTSNRFTLAAGRYEVVVDMESHGGDFARGLPMFGMFDDNSDVYSLSSATYLRGQTGTTNTSKQRVQNRAFFEIDSSGEYSLEFFQTNRFPSSGSGSLGGGGVSVDTIDLTVHHIYIYPVGGSGTSSGESFDPTVPELELPTYQGDTNVRTITLPASPASWMTIPDIDEVYHSNIIIAQVDTQFVTAALEGNAQLEVHGPSGSVSDAQNLVSGKKFYKFVVHNTAIDSGTGLPALSSPVELKVSGTDSGQVSVRLLSSYHFGGDFDDASWDIFDGVFNIIDEHESWDDLTDFIKQTHHDHIYRGASHNIQTHSTNALDLGLSSTIAAIASGDVANVRIELDNAPNINQGANADLKLAYYTNAGVLATNEISVTQSDGPHWFRFVGLPTINNNQVVELKLTGTGRTGYNLTLQVLHGVVSRGANAVTESVLKLISDYEHNSADHDHSEYSSNTHTHPGTYAPYVHNHQDDGSGHVHSQYAGSSHNHSQYADSSHSHSMAGGTQTHNLNFVTADLTGADVPNAWHRTTFDPDTIAVGSDVCFEWPYNWSIAPSMWHSWPGSPTRVIDDQFLADYVVAGTTFDQRTASDLDLVQNGEVHYHPIAAVDESTTLPRNYSINEIALAVDSLGNLVFYTEGVRPVVGDATMTMRASGVRLKIRP